MKLLAANQPQQWVRPVQEAASPYHQYGKSYALDSLRRPGCDRLLDKNRSSSQSNTLECRSVHSAGVCALCRRLMKNPTLQRLTPQWLDACLGSQVGDQ